MKITPTSDDNGRKVLHVEADWADLAADYEDIVAAYGKVSVPGFRPGKVPRSVIEKRFQKKIISDLSHRATQCLGRKTVRESGIEVLGPAEAEVLECVRGRAFRAVFRYHPMPKLELPDLASLKTDAGDADPRDQISLQLLDLVRFDIPDSLVQEELALDNIEGAEIGSTEWKAASARIRLMLILKKIAKEEGIVVDEKDVDDRIASKAVEFKSTKEVLRSELEKGGIQRLKDMLLAESTLEYLMEKVDVTQQL